MNWIRFCKVFSVAHMAGAIASSAFMFTASADMELVRGCICMLYCTVIAAALMMVECHLKGEA